MTLISYAQNFEDVMLWRALGHVEHGRYLDVGAQDPVVDSVSKAFYERGWRGWHVEPAAAYSEALRRERPDENVLTAAIGSGGLLHFHEFPETGLSTLDANIAEHHMGEGFECIERSVPVVPLAAVLDDMACDGEIHWMKIDVEGAERDVLESWGDSPVRPWVLVIESTLPLSQELSHQSWEPLMLAKGYQFAYFDGLNRFYVAREHPELLEKFASPPSVFDDFALSGTASQPFCRHLLNVVQQHAENEVQVAAEIVDVRGRLEEGLAALAGAREAIGEQQARAESAERECEQLRQQMADAKTEIERMQAAAAVREAQVAAEIVDVRGRLEEELAALAGAREAIGEQQARAESAERECEQLRRQVADAKRESERLRAKIEETRLQGEQLLAEVDARFDTALERRMTPVLQSLMHWQSMAHEADMRAAGLHAELGKSLDNAHHWFVEHNRLQGRLGEVEAHLAATLDSNHAWFVKTKDLERQLIHVLSSRSWKITAPLRATRRAASVVATGMLKRPVLLAIRVLYRYPALWRPVSAWMKRRVGLFDRLKALAITHGAVPPPSAGSPAPAALVPPADTGTGMATVDELRSPAMSAYQQNLFNRLKKR